METGNSGSRETSGGSSASSATRGQPLSFQTQKRQQCQCSHSVQQPQGHPGVPHSAQGDNHGAGRLLKKCFSAALSHWVHRSPMASRKYLRSLLQEGGFGERGGRTQAPLPQSHQSCFTVTGFTLRFCIRFYFEERILLVKQGTENPCATV